MSTTFNVCVALVGLALSASADRPLYLGIDLSSSDESGKFPLVSINEVPLGGWSDRHKKDMIVLRRVEPGRFLMKSDGKYAHPRPSEIEPHPVTISRPYYIGVFEITQRQYELVTGRSCPKCSYRDPEAAVDYVSWRSIRSVTNSEDVAVSKYKTELRKYDWPNGRDVASESFIGRLRSMTSCSGIDLPTEAQWEYACRYGEDVEKIQDRTRLGDIDNRGVRKVGLYEPNKIGLYDMDGNALEWCLDKPEGAIGAPCFDPVGADRDMHGEPQRVLRGGVDSGIRYVEYIGWDQSGFRIVINDPEGIGIPPLKSLVSDK